MGVGEHLQAGSELSTSGRLRQEVGEIVHIFHRVREGEGEKRFEEGGREERVLQPGVQVTGTSVPVKVM